MFKSIKLITISSVMFVLCFAFNASAQTTINSNATVVSSVTFGATTDLNFGSFVPSAAVGTVTFSAGDATPTIGGGVTAHLGGEVGGVTAITGPSAGDTVQVFLSATNLSGPGPDMTIVPDCQLTGGGGATADSCTFTSAGGSENIQIGGVLSVGANQTPGVYNGTITVTAGYFP
jgi:hypothetical protein